jgi:hypothetical protein
MSGTHDNFEIFTSAVMGAAFLYYVWHKRKTQFGSPRSQVRVFMSERPLHCHVCEGNVFQKREGLLNTTWVTFFKLDSLNESAHCLACNSCGYVHWFAQRRGVNPSVYLRYEGGGTAESARMP